MSRWMESLPVDVLRRLENCTSKKSDVQTLTDCKWKSMIEDGKDKDGFTKEDALVYVLDLLDCNGRWFDFSREEYNSLVS